MAKRKEEVNRSIGSAPVIEGSQIRISMVGFFDLLGFSSRVERVKTPKDFAHVAGSIATIQRYFEHRSDDEGIKELHRILDKKVLAFSDCIVTAVSAETKMAKQEGLFDVLGAEIWDIAYSQNRCVLDGHFLRGGVDFGNWYFHNDLLVSPAMVGAYKEEHERACYPVVAVSERLYRLLSRHPGRQFYSKRWDPFPAQFRQFIHPRSGKRIRFINYLGLMASSLDWQHDRATYEAYMAAPRDSEERNRIMDQGYTANLAGYFEQHRKQVKRAHAAPPVEVKEKYLCLARYHNAILEQFLPRRCDLRLEL
jgi:hypothetical protein